LLYGMYHWLILMSLAPVASSNPVLSILEGDKSELLWKVHQGTGDFFVLDLL
jgi:hypothetical protein